MAVIDVDLYDARTYTAGLPHDAFRTLRDECPVYWQDERAMLGQPAGTGYWAVTRHADVLAVNRNPEIFSSHLGGTQIKDPAPKDLAFVQQMMLNLDPPAHTRLRRIVNRAFTPRNVDRLGDTIRQRAAAIVDRVADRGECDFPIDIGADLPLLTLAEVMGVPIEDRRLLFDWSNRIIGFQDEEYRALGPERPAAASGPEVGAGGAGRRSRSGGKSGEPGPERERALEPEDPPPDPRSREALSDMFDYAHALAEEKRRQPGEDVLSLLLVSDAQGGDGPGVTDEEFENFFFLLAVAGNETLRNGIPGGMLALIEHPDQRQRLIDDPALLPTAVDEMLRWVTPVIQFRRTAAQGTVLSGQRIEAGQKVVVYYASANFDERAFGDPGPTTFDVGRRPNDHLSFGAGPHLCLGAGLARLQMKAMFAELLRRLPDIELAGPVERLQSNFQAGIKHMPVTYTPQRSGG